MKNLILNDENVYPDDTVLARHLGKVKSTWDSFMDVLKVDYPLLAVEWRYYNDGKRWLCKVTKKAKTICWISVWEGYFKVGFYFNSKAEEVLKNSSLDETLKKRWLKNENNDRFRSIALDVKKKADLKTIKELIEIKGRTK